MRRTDRMVENEHKILEILEECKVCRVGLHDQGNIYIVPLNYGYCFEQGKLTLYFHGAKEGRKLNVIRSNPNVGFEMDCGHKLIEAELACQYSYYFSSIIGNGKAEIVEAQEEKNKALELIMRHMAGKEFHEFEANKKLQQIVTIIKVVVDEFTCKIHQQ